MVYFRYIVVNTLHKGDNKYEDDDDDDNNTNDNNNNFLKYLEHRVKTRKDGARPALFHVICYLGCSVVICVVLCIVCV
jgi:hypothetical protein